jgi:D-alanine--poly(phosphoribitol) ligase subunit 1
VPEGTRGEIVIAGANVSPGYLYRPDLTEAAFFCLEQVQAYRTGDWGHLESGLLFFDGRIDEQVKLHGYRIELGDVEANLRGLPDVVDAAVVPILAAGRPDALAAFVVLREPLAVTGFGASQALRRRLAERLPSYMLPRVVQFVDALPMTANGKVDRRALVQTLA